MSYKGDLANHKIKNKKGRETENDIENNDQELLNLNEVDTISINEIYSINEATIPSIMNTNKS